jgi:ornithine carrier protein
VAQAFLPASSCPSPHVQRIFAFRLDTPADHPFFFKKKRTPIELVKCKMQVQMLSTPFNIPSTPRKLSPPPPPLLSTRPASFILNPIPHRNLASLASVRKTLPGPFTIIANILRTSGPSGLWLGHTGTMFRETGGTAAWFASKEFFASLLLSRRSHASANRDSEESRSQDDTTLAPWESALSGALAGVLCVLALYPADTVKSAIQTAEELRPPTAFLPAWQIKKHMVASPTFRETAKAMYRAQGWRGLYAGCGMTVARAIPSSGVVFAVYDGLSQRFG